MKKPSGKLLIMLVLAGLAFGGFYISRKRPITVEIASYEKSVPIRVFGLGTVEARIVSKIGFKLSSSIIELNADEGQHVRKGDVLARLDASEQKARLARAKAGVLAARAALEGANSAILKARAVLAQKRRTNNRKKALFRKKTISAEAAEAAKLELDTALAEFRIAESSRLSARAALETALAQEELEKASLDQYVLKAPFDAIIVERHMELGTVVKAGEPLFTLVDPSSVWVLGHISENRSGLIAIGQSAKIRLRSRPHDLYDGKVVRIDIESDRVTEERRVYISCKDCRKKFNLGEQAEVYITTAILDRGLLVPENAVDDFDERRMKGTVWIVKDGKLRRQPVTFGHRTLDARLSIRSGLPENAKVLKKLPRLLREGRSAKIRQEAKS